MRRVRAALLATFSCLAIACSGGSSTRGRAGTQCDLNSDCAAPLICDLGACRNQCNTTRDCALGTACIFGEGGFGVCQLVEETRCALDSECPEELVCRERQCVNVCVEDRDCPAGARCEESACIDRETGLACVSDSGCPAPQRCALDGRCRIECMSSRECRLGTECVTNQCLASCSAAGECPLGYTCRDSFCRASPPAGPMDGGTPDAGPPGDAGSGACVGTLPVQRVAAGMSFTCATLGGAFRGRVACWGLNSSRQLGTGTPASPGSPTLSPTPVLVEGVFDAIDVRAGHDFACAMRSDLGMQCWGNNTYAQLGLGTSSPSSPAMLSPLGGVRVVDPGAGHACANVRGTELRCWGDRTSGKLGDGMTTGTQPMPTLVPAIVMPRDVAAASQNTCVISGTAGDELWCWGQDDRGQVGNGGGAFGPAVTSPVQIPGQWSFVDVAYSHACALDLGGSIWCWGDASYGGAGDGLVTIHNVYAPTAIPDPMASVYLAVHTGDLFTCALRSDRAVQCWGWNTYGQLGDGAPGPDRGSPGLTVALPGAAAQLTVGQQHACAVVGSEAWCWGNNELGQLGRSLATPYGAPEAVGCFR